jgi:ABC-type multidrug transport system fused ATPase/permease subunit
VELFGTSYFFGGIFGSVFLSSIPDKHGRALIYKILLFASFIMHVNMLITQSPIHIVIINFLSGIISYAMSMCTLIITEYINRSSAGILMSVHSAIFPLSGIIIALFFIFINSWRFLFVFTSLYSLLMAYVVKKYFVESPRWLNSKNKISESLEALKKIAEINDKVATFNIFLEQNQNLIHSDGQNLKEVKKSYNLIEIFNLKSQKLNIICLTYVWFASGFCFYGLILNLEHLGGNLFVNSIVTFIGEMFSELLSGFLADEFGRILVLKISGIMGGVGFIMYELIEDGHWIKSVFIFMTSFGFSGTFNLIYIYSPEVFPTTIRSTVMGWLYFTSRLGAMLVPGLTPHIPHNPILFGCLSLVTVYASSFLTETLGKEIPDDVPEAKRQTSFLTTSNRKLSSSNSYNVSFTRKTIVSDSYFKL